jgi:hypothetical protein
MSMTHSEGVTVYYCHSWESVFALTEQYVRLFLRSFKIQPFRVYIPQLVTPQGITMPASPFLFAIAIDSAAAGAASGTPVTLAFTCTGTDLILFADFVYAASTSDMKYNAVAMTVIQDQATAGVNGCQLFYLVAPSTGTNNIVETGQSGAIAATSYSGAAQTGQPDSSAKNQAIAASSVTTSTTVVASNCWLVGAAGNAGGEMTAGTGTTRRAFDAGGNVIGDSNGTVSTGSQSLQFNGGVSNYAMVVASFAPAAGGGAEARIDRGLNLMGIGQ